MIVFIVNAFCCTSSVFICKVTAIVKTFDYVLRYVVFEKLHLVYYAEQKEMVCRLHKIVQTFSKFHLQVFAALHIKKQGLVLIFSRS